MERVTVKKIKLNALANYVYFFLYAIFNFILNPLLISYMGSYYFGIWKSCTRIFELANFADGRSSQALKWIIAKKANSLDHDEKQKAVSSAIKIWMLFFPVLIITLATLIYFLPFLIGDIDIEKFSEIRFFGLILGANIVLMPLLEIPDAILIGTNNGHKSKFIQTFWLIFSNIFLVNFAYHDYGISAMAMVVVTTTLCNGLSVCFIAKKKFSWLRYQKPNRGNIKSFFNYSGWILLWAFVEKLLLSSEILVLGYLEGTQSVSGYTFTSFVAQFGLNIVLLFGSALMPTIGAMLAETHVSKLKNILDFYREIIIFAVTLIGAGILLLNYSFVSLWSSQEYYLGNEFNFLIVIGFMQVALIRSESQIDDLGLNIKHRVISGFIFTLFGIILAILFYKFSSSTVELILIGLILGRLPLNIIIPRLVFRLTQVKQYEYFMYLKSLIILVICYFIGTTLQLDSWGTFFVIAILAGLILIALLFLLLISKKHRIQIINNLKSKHGRTG